MFTTKLLLSLVMKSNFYFVLFVYWNHRYHSGSHKEKIQMNLNKGNVLMEFQCVIVGTFQHTVLLLSTYNNSNKSFIAVMEFRTAKTAKFYSTAHSSFCFQKKVNMIHEINLYMSNCNFNWY